MTWGITQMEPGQVIGLAPGQTIKWGSEMNAWFWNLSNEAQEEILTRLHAAMIRRRHGTGGIVLPLPDLPNELAEICRRAGTEIEVLT